MVNEMVKIKSGRGTLQLIFADGASYTDIRKNIEKKLASSSSFFARGTVILIPKDHLKDEEKEDLQELLHTHGLICRQQSEKDAELSVRRAINAAKTKKLRESGKENPKTPEEIVFNKTLRGGQEIKTEGSVLVVGNVNPGAQIIAGGSIHVRGTCRGFVHAGAAGDPTASIVAERLVPTQIRIADHIARSPDTISDTGQTERAYIKDGHIVIEPMSH